MVDRVGAVGVEVAQWVIGDGRKMDDSVEAFEVSLLDLAQVSTDPRNTAWLTSEIAVRKKSTVETDNVDSFVSKHRCHHGADISFMPCDQNAHDLFPLIGFLLRLLLGDLAR